MKNWEPIIYVTIDKAYGRRIIYPYCEQAKKLCKMLGGQKSLTEQNIRDAYDFGLAVHQVVVANGKEVKVGQIERLE